MPQGVPAFTKGDLLEASGLSSKTFDMIRKAARVKGPSHGALNWEFPVDDVRQIIRTAESGKFSDRGPDAALGLRRLLTEHGFEMEEARKLKKR